MTVEITIEVPDTLGEQLRQVQDRLPEILERGLHEVLAESDESDVIGADERSIIATLANQPTPEAVLQLRPSVALQARIDTLLAQSKDGTLSVEERAELDRFEMLEHLVRMAKGYALERLARGA